MAMCVPTNSIVPFDNNVEKSAPTIRSTDQPHIVVQSIG